ncbi:polysaccharide biosynthesis C-terminal domain-containing protein [soil metagenome]
MRSKITSLASDTLVYGVSTVVGRFLTFLLTPLYTNYLSPSEMGEVAAIYSMIAFVNILYSLGMEPAYMRFFERNNEERNRSVFSVAFWLVAGIGVFVTLATVIFAVPISTSSFLKLDENGASLVRIAALIPLFDALVLIPFARLRMQQRPRVFAMMRLLAIVVNVVLNILFVVVWHMRIEGVIYAGIISSAVSFAVFVPSILSSLRLAFDRALYREMVRFGLPTVPSSFSSIMVQVADRPIMLMLSSSAAVGMYQTNFRLAIPMMLFVTVFEYAWKPFYLHHRDDVDAKETFARIFTLFTAVCGAVFLITSIAMPIVVQLPFVGGRFINPTYWSGMHIIPIILLAYVFNGFMINFAVGPHITKRTATLPIATGVAAVVNVLATFIGFPLLGIDGAAWAKVIAYVAGAAVLYVVVQRIYPMKYDWTRVLLTMIAAAALYGVTLITPPNSTLHVIVRIAVVPAYILLLVPIGVISPQTLRTLRGLVQR